MIRLHQWQVVPLDDANASRLTRGETVNGTIILSPESSQLRLYALRVKNTGGGYLHEARISVLVPGFVYAVSSTRPEVDVDVREAVMQLVWPDEDGRVQVIRDDPRLTHARAWTNKEDGSPSSRFEYAMPSGTPLPDLWQPVNAWGSNIVAAIGGSSTTYRLDALPPGEEWWVGTWYFQDRPDRNEADKGATFTAWADGQFGRLSHTAQLIALQVDEGAEGAPAGFCEWKEAERPLPSISWLPN